MHLLGLRNHLALLHCTHPYLCPSYLETCTPHVQFRVFLEKRGAKKTRVKIPIHITSYVAQLQCCLPLCCVF